MRQTAGAGDSFRLAAGAVPAAPATPARWVTLRSFLLGTLSVILVSALVPYNDYVVANANLVGSYLPVIVVLTFFMLIVLVNGPLHRWAPRRALAGGELVVILAMMLAACSIPSQGLLRSLIPSLVNPFYFGAQEPAFWRAFVALDLPNWLFPVGDVAQGNASPIMSDFYARVQPGESIPYRAWLVPLAGWGIFVFATFAVFLALSTVLRPQWAVNERLPFPVAQLQCALIQPPRPGRMLNDMLGNRLFWLALGLVVFLHGINALNSYFPRFVPPLNLRWDARTLFSEPPWNALSEQVKVGQIFFTFIGIAYFIQSRSAFSLWAIFLITQLITVQRRQMHADIPVLAWQDQHLGASVAFFLGFLWIGRKYWLMVLGKAWRGQKSGGSESDPALSCRTAVAVIVAGLAVMVIWLLLLKVQLWIAIGIIAAILLAHITVARVVAETGLTSVRSMVTWPQVFTNLSPDLVSGRDVYFSSFFSANGSWNTRESLLVFAMHAEQAGQSLAPSQRQRRQLLGLVAFSVLLAFVVSSAASLRAYYTHATPLSGYDGRVLNYQLLEVKPKVDVIIPLTRHSEGRFEAKQHNAPLHIAIGFVVTALLQAAALRWSSWPFMPVGYLLCPIWLTQILWLSLLIGWLIKLLVVRFGGASLYQRLRPLFLGLIFGEAFASGGVLLVNLFLASAGYEYKVLELLPI